MRPSLVLCCTAVICSGCTIPRTASEPDVPQTLSIGYAGAGGQSELLLKLTTESLLQTTSEGLHEPQLAESWSVSDDGLSVTLTLRGNVRFHDGVELSADVVKQALDAARTDLGQLQAHPSLGDIRAIEIVDDRLRIELKQPSALLLDDLGIRIQRGTGERPIGTGPFSLESETAGSMTLVANPSYYQGRPSMDVVTVTAFPTVRTAWAAMMRGEIDFLFDVPVGAREFVEAESSIELFTTERPYAYMVGFNVRGSPFSNTRVRQALNHAVDRRIVIDRALRGDGRAASGIWPSHWAYSGVERVYRYDPTLADQLLTQAGYPPPSHGAPNPPEKMPARLRFTCLVLADASPDEQIALLVQRQLYDIDVDMQVEALDARAIRERVTAGAFDAVLVPQNLARTISRLYPYWHSSQPAALFGYTAGDGALDALRHAVTRDALADAAASFQSVLYDDPPAIFIAVPQRARAVHRRFDVGATEGDVMETVWRWKRSDSLE